MVDLELGRFLGEVDRYHNVYDSNGKRGVWLVDIRTNTKEWFSSVTAAYEFIEHAYPGFGGGM